MKPLCIIFDGLPNHEPPRFVEAEDTRGRSITVGKWRLRPDGLAELRIDVDALPDLTGGEAVLDMGVEETALRGSMKQTVEQGLRTFVSA